jgi:hypothetical protein
VREWLKAQFTGELVVIDDKALPFFMKNQLIVFERPAAAGA